MKQFLFEIKKVIGQRFFIAITAVLLVICTSLCVFSMRKSTSQLRKEGLVEAYELYNRDPEAARELFEKYDQDRKAGIDVPDEYSFLRNAIRTANGNAQFSDMILKVSESARRKALELERDGYGEGDFIYDYQKNCEEMYLAVAEEVELPVCIVSGWNNYFAQSYTTYFILAAVFLLVCTVYIPEKTDGIYPLLRSTKRGRHSLSGAKLGAVILLSLLITVIFSGASFLVIAVKLGFSSPQVPVQILSGLDYCPYIITVGDYFAIHSFLRLAAVLVFALICAAVTTLKCDYVISFSGAGLLILVNYLLNTAKYTSVNNPCAHFNLFSLCDCNGIFSRYYAADVFGSLVRFEYFGLWLLLPLIVISALSAYLTIAQGRGYFTSVGILSVMIKKLSLPRSREKKMPALRVCRSSMTAFEAQKILSKIGIILILILLAVFRFNSAMTSYSSPKDADEIFYREYMERLDGEYTDEKAKYIADEIAYINAAIKRYEAMQDIGDELSNEERLEIIEAANYAYSHKNAAERALGYSQRLRELRDLGDRDALFLYESGWSLLLGRDADLLAFAIILIALCNIFGVEFGKSSSSGRFADILRTTKLGRGKTFRSKLSLAVNCAFTAFVIFEAADFYLILKNYTLPHPESASVILFSKVQSEAGIRFSGVDLLDFALAGTFLRFFATVVFSLGVFALSAAVKKNISVMLISALVILLPSAIAGNSGLTVLSKIDYLPLAAGAGLIKLSEAATPDFPFAMPISAVIILSLAMIAIITAARSAWCNTYHKTRRLKT